MSKVSEIIKQARRLEDRKFARSLRKSALDSMVKMADQGILQRHRGAPVDYPTRDHSKAERGGKEEKDLYGVGLPDHKNTDLSVDKYDRSLSTRYSPDRPGVQARRVSDGVFQDPITNKTYDWNEGFKTEDGAEFSGGGVSLQTDILYRD